MRDNKIMGINGKNTPVIIVHCAIHYASIGKIIEIDTIVTRIECDIRNQGI